ncbi:hypothetical protein OG800_35960 [Streptomyces sp. NBC_00445]|uniref:hypothetical protein n=1 Tax=Streptomyces sp. NBC_00445 TaxID=2975745 RepID=UPI002E1C0EEF
MELTDEFIRPHTPTVALRQFLAHLVQGLAPHHGYGDLNIQTLWSLMQIRHNLL